MSRLPLLCTAIACLAATPSRAESPAVNAERLLSRLRTAYAQPASFAPSALRFPLRSNVQEELTHARETLEANSTDFEAHWKLARLMEEAGDPGAEQEWRAAAALGENEVKTHPTDVALLEREVEAMVGGDVSLRVVTYAEKLLATEPRSWRAQLLAGDAYLRRADYNWRVLVRLSRGSKPAATAQAVQMRADLATCSRAYDRAVELAPAEAAPRAGRIALVLAKPVMASFLPPGSLETASRPDLAAIRKDLMELVMRNPGQVSALWFASHFLATQAQGMTAPTLEERQILESSLAKADPKGDDRAFLAEARGLLACANQDWAAARTQLESALALLPTRAFAADWLGMVETNSPDPNAQKLARARTRLAAHPRPQDHVLVAIYEAEVDAPAAIAELRKALDEDVQNANVRHNLGVLLLQRNPTSVEARHHLKESLALDPDNRESAFALATAMALAGDIPDARQTCETILKLEELDPNLKARCEATLKDLPTPSPKTPDKKPANGK